MHERELSSRRRPRAVDPVRSARSARSRSCAHLDADGVPAATLAALAKDKAKLRAVLLSHGVEGKVTAAQAMKLHSAKILEGKALASRVSGDKVIVGGATVIKPT